MKTFTIGANDKGQRLDRFLHKVMPQAPQSIIYKSLRKKRVKCNGKRITDGSLKLCEGDVLELYFNDEYFLSGSMPFWINLTPNIDIVYEDEHILVMNKPSGLLTQADNNAESLEAHMRAYLFKKGEYNPITENSFIPSLCHRIDRNTSGLVIGAKDIDSLRILNQKIKDKEIRKFYLCETEGTPKLKEGEISGWILKDEAGRKMVFLDTKKPGASACLTRYKVIKSGKTALIEAELLTGKTHQIRVGFAHLGHPLVGDVKYGAQKNGEGSFQHLTANRLVFSFTTDGGCLDYLKDKEIVLK